MKDANTLEEQNKADEKGRNRAKKKKKQWPCIEYYDFDLIRPNGMIIILDIWMMMTMTVMVVAVLVMKHESAKFALKG